MADALTCPRCAGPMFLEGEEWCCLPCGYIAYVETMSKDEADAELDEEAPKGAFEGKYTESEDERAEARKGQYTPRFVINPDLSIHWWETDADH